MSKYQARELPLTVAVGSTLAMGSLQAATISVNGSLDAPIGTYQYLCTLRAAVAAAHSDGAVDGCEAGSRVDDIQMLPGLASSTITLGSTLVIRSAMNGSGPVPDDAGGITISGNDARQAIRIVQQRRGGAIDVSLETKQVPGPTIRIAVEAASAAPEPVCRFVTWQSSTVPVGRSGSVAPGADNRSVPATAARCAHCSRLGEAAVRNARDEGLYRSLSSILH
jgi:hypothetical protein